MDEPLPQPAPPTAEATGRDVGVIVVTYGAEDVIALCLQSLLAVRSEWAATGGRMRIAVIDNASPDGTMAAIRDLASGARPAPPDGLPFDLGATGGPLALVEGGPDLAPSPEADLVLVQSGANRGFAGGVNIGLAHFAADPGIGHFWVLNPDSMVPPGSVAALAAHVPAMPAYGLIGGRVIFLDAPDTIQIDGGLLNRWTGVTGNYNLFKPVSSAPPTDADLDFIAGSSMVASRTFYEAVGPLHEDYFLYYEEVDWALRRGDLPLGHVGGLVVYHWGGTAIGSPVVGRRATPFSLYFKQRARLRFQRRFHPWALPVTWLYSLAQALRETTLRRSPEGAWAILSAICGLPAPRRVRDRLGPEAAPYAFAGRHG